MRFPWFPGTAWLVDHVTASIGVTPQRTYEISGTIPMAPLTGQALGELHHERLGTPDSNLVITGMPGSAWLG